MEASETPCGQRPYGVRRTLGQGAARLQPQGRYDLPLSAVIRGASNPGVGGAKIEEIASRAISSNTGFRRLTAYSSIGRGQRITFLEARCLHQCAQQIGGFVFVSISKCEADGANPGLAIGMAGESIQIKITDPPPYPIGRRRDNGASEWFTTGCQDERSGPLGECL